MTRKEWIQENCPDKLNPTSYGGVEDCPLHYPKLKEVDPTIVPGMQCPPGINHQDRCTKCWNTEIKNDFSKVPLMVGMTFYTIVPIEVGKNHNLWIVGEFRIISISMVHNTMLRCVGYDYDLDVEYIFNYDLNENEYHWIPKVQQLQKKYPNLNLSLFVTRKQAEDALEKWTGNNHSWPYILVKKGD